MGEVPREDIDIPVVVQGPEGGPHAVAVPPANAVHARAVGEFPAAIVYPKNIWLHIVVGHVDVHVTIIVEIYETGAARSFANLGEIKSRFGESTTVVDQQ